MRSQRHVADGQRHASRFDVGITVGRRLDRVDQRLSGAAALEPAEFFGGNDNHLVAAMHRYMLRPFATNFAHELAEAGLGVLQ
jgi:hypothetical protein